MIGLRCIITFKGLPAIKKSDLAKIFRAGYRHIADVWQREMRPKHFTFEGAAEYQYKPRTKGYLLYKGSKSAREKKHSIGTTRPLVFTGQSERAAMNPRIVATSKGAHIYIHAPNLNWHDWTVKEMTTVSEQENKRLANELGDNIASQLSKWPAAVVQVAT